MADRGIDCNLCFLLELLSLFLITLLCLTVCPARSSPGLIGRPDGHEHAATHPSELGASVEPRRKLPKSSTTRRLPTRKKTKRTPRTRRSAGYDFDNES